jgi:pantoate--beta-alanine ligase
MGWLIILKKVFRDLNVKTDIRTVDTRRTEDGLALSSRNSYLSEGGRKSALAISGALKLARSLITEKKIHDPAVIRKKMLNVLIESGEVEPDYVELVSLKTLEKIEKIDENGTLIAIAAYVEGVRLIDNTIFGEI